MDDPLDVSDSSCFRDLLAQLLKKGGKLGIEAKRNGWYVLCNQL